jgi:hypothetical protein
MAWKATGAAAVRKQRGRWVVRIDGLDTETGQKRPRQLGRTTPVEQHNRPLLSSPNQGPRRPIGGRWRGRSMSG